MVIVVSSSMVLGKTGTIIACLFS